jgi:hypothetical protein
LDSRAVSQLLWSLKGREEWFSLGENHEGDVAPSDFLRAALTEGDDVRLSSRKAACSSMAPPSSTGNLGSVYTNCETAILAGAAGKLTSGPPGPPPEMRSRTAQGPAAARNVKQSTIHSKQRPCSLFCNGAKRLFVLFFIANSSDVYRQLRTSHQQNLVRAAISLREP